jgi:hypothetical protein
MVASGARNLPGGGLPFEQPKVYGVRLSNLQKETPGRLKVAVAAGIPVFDQVPFPEETF